MHPKVSVIIPVYNGATYLDQAIESALAQTVAPFEIIVVDDGSTDATAQVAQAYDGVRYAHQANAGTSTARNTGVTLAQGDQFAFLDADDVWLPQKLEKQLAALDASSAPAMVFTYVQEFISPELPAEIRVLLRCDTASLAGVLPSACLIARDAFLQVGPFAPQLMVAEFADWVLRANEAGLTKIVLPETLVRRRVHMTNKGIRQRADFSVYAHIIQASLKRRRAAGQEE